MSSSDEHKRPEGGQNFRVILSALKYWNHSVVDKIEDPLDRAEGRRFLLRTLATSAENYIDSWNPDTPHFHSTVSANRKTYADSPDTDYLRSVLLLKNNRRYRIWGVIPPTTLYFGIQLYRAKGLPGNNLPDTAIPRDSQGRFEVIVTAEDPATLPAELRKKTILRGHGDEVSVIVRQYFSDRTKEVPITVHIELLNKKGTLAHAEFNDTFFNIGAQRALANLDATLTNTLQAHETLSKLCYRDFVRADGSRLFPTLDNRYLMAYFDGMRLKPNTPESEAPLILVRGKRPRCRYFSMCLYNRWLESLDYVCHTVHLSHVTTFFTSDGTFEYAIGPVNPGHRNWLDTCDHDGVYALTRELLPEDEAVPYEVEITTVGKAQARADRTFMIEQSRL